MRKRRRRAVRLGRDVYDGEVLARSRSGACRGVLREGDERAGVRRRSYQVVQVVPHPGLLWVGGLLECAGVGTGRARPGSRSRRRRGGPFSSSRRVGVMNREEAVKLAGALKRDNLSAIVVD